MVRDEGPEAQDDAIHGRAALRRRTLSGVRAVIVLNYVSVPLSFLAGVLFGWVSPVALGYYSAAQLFLNTVLVFVVLGGPRMFTRLVPTLPPERRVSFFGSYALVILASSLALVGAAMLLVPGLLETLRTKLGGPSLATLIGVALLGSVWAFSCYFLYGALEGVRGVLAGRFINLALLGAALVGAGPLRAQLASAPADYVWKASLIVYALAALVGLFAIASAPSLRRSGRFAWHLPRGFWSVAVYAHLSTIVEWVYLGLSPSLVLVWLDVRALATLHVASRFPLLLATFPGTLTDVVAPGLAALDRDGERERAVAQARAVVNASLIPLVPMAIACAFFASDLMAVFNPEFRAGRDLLRIVVVSAAAMPFYYLGSGALAAFGAFRSYLGISAIYVVSALVLAVLLIPRIGLPGAAWAMLLSVAIQQLALALVLSRRIGFRIPSRALAGWASIAAASLVSAWLDPGRIAAALLTGVFVLAFAAMGQVRPREVAGLVGRLVGRA